ncbi:MAG: NADH-quinone oxidoreductase subunit NuoH [Dehalococcoidia bacterium]|uniref:NADH-quinone oxidoreductase subunit NuoH n=1 Tax=Candidatus Amarobacter glycogenicus TaxID=3140699 RepID=UPI00313614FC|nr:NADH-quinone oxidoreductase subunit NuoH [Dehalococcoidia bacterium]MBK7330290.1 NADH-quinone oxidoreductase subunit NuoH [Dehalococcoidia bacterium]MBK9344567.1 NADH-quinone oxidoreductase subunit NuoH [Dehalococcoidia bacterium]
MLFADPLFGLPSWTDAIIRVVLVVLAMTIVVMYLTYGERKVVARFQQRLGPTETGPGGLIQAFADAFKLVLKEDIRPTNADRWVFELAPYATFVPVFMVLLALPFAHDWGVRDLGLGLFYVFAILGLNIVGIMMAGLGSGNKYALLGGIRAAAQMISYEIPLVISLLCVAMITSADTGNEIGTLNLNVIAALQEDRPYVLLQPLAFLIFFTAMLSELHRAPFDIPVAESEIVGGYFVEYSGIRWSMFQLSEYASMWGFSVFGSVVFLGGWAFPFGADAHWSVQLATTMVKSLSFIVLIFWVRTTVPRLRIDQLMSFCWKVLLPMSIVQMLMNGVILAYDWPQELLTLTSGAGAALLVAIIIKRAVRRPSKDLVGTYKTLGAPAQ